MERKTERLERARVNNMGRRNATIAAKDAEREQISEDVKAFLRKGGRITIIEAGGSGVKQEKVKRRQIQLGKERV